MHSDIQVRHVPFLHALWPLFVALPLAACGGGDDDDDDGQEGSFPTVDVPADFQIEKVADGLTYPTAIGWDDQGLMYVLEAGGQFLDEPVPARLMLVENGVATPVVELESQGLATPVVGMQWFEGGFYMTHRSPVDRSGAISKVGLDGTVTPVIGGFLDAKSEHPLNDIRLGPDGRMYVCAGPATNSGVVGIDNAPFVALNPELQATPCRQIVLTGQNYLTPDFRTPDQTDTVLTGAFVPFGTPTSPGQVIASNRKCGGAIHVFNPSDPAGTLRFYAWGLRNVIGVTWGTNGDLYAAVNGYDVRGSRPFNDVVDPTYRILLNAWYGWPDFSARFQPIVEPQFDSPNAQKAPVVVGGVPQGKELSFVIDHAASNLATPNPSVIVGEHPVNSSPSKLDTAPASWGPFAGHLFVAEWGDLTPGTNPLQNEMPGYRVVRIDPAGGGTVQPFLRNVEPGPASAQGAAGQGIERPFDVRFGPDDAMYVVDFGIARVNPARAAEGQVPYEFAPQTGVVWKVTRVP